VLWFFGFFVFLWMDAAKTENERYATSVLFCARTKTSLADCQKKYEDLGFKPSWEFAGANAAFAFAPIPFAWLFGWIVLLVSRWVWSGFREKRAG
jgi:hypothetical protein